MSEALMYFAILALLFFGILAIINYKVVPFIPFLPVNVPVAVPAGVNSITQFSSKAAPSDTAIITKANTSGLDYNLKNYTISFDCFLDGTYKSTTVPRVLLYYDLSSNPTSKNITSNTFSKYNEDVATSIPLNHDTSYSLTTDQTDIIGVFSNTNFIVYIDSIKNDMKVAIVTVDKNTNSLLEVLPSINNIPINSPFQITITVTSSFIEIYKNKQLLYTYILKNTPKLILPAGANNYSLYSPIGYIGSTVKVANVQYFDKNITSSQVRTLTNTLSAPSIFN